MKKKNNTKKARRKSNAKKVTKGLMAGAIAISAVAPTMAVNVKADELSVFPNGGEGTAESPFIITNIHELGYITDFPSSHFKLVEDIDFGRMPLLEPIGTKDVPFTGVFDGNGHEISNYVLTANAKGMPTGLFNAVDGGTIKDLTINGALVSNVGSSMGALVGHAKKPIIQNVKINESYITADTESWSQSTGLLIGSLEGDNGTTKIENIEVAGGSVTGNGSIGGLIGRVDGIFKSGSYVNNIDVNTKAEGIGGTDNVGSLFGITGSSTLKVSNIIVDGTVSGSEAVGGLIGHGTGISNGIVIENVIVKTIINGKNATNAMWLGALMGLDAGGTRDGIYIASPTIENPTTSPHVSLMFGTPWVDGTQVYTNAKYLETISLNGVPTENNGLTFPTYSEAEKVQKDTYAGFDFEKDWGIYDGKSEPFLLFSMTDEERAEYEKENGGGNIYAEATLAVETAESTLLQEDVNIAQALVTPLPTGEEKTDLQNRLNAVQDAINKVIAIDKATSAVEKAEASKAREDFNTAQDLVNALPSGEEKTELENRLNELQAIIEEAESDADALANATKAVEKAEASKTREDFNKAQDLVNALKPSVEQNELQKSLDALSFVIESAEALEDATKAVDKAESTRLQGDIDTAQGLVTALKLPSAEKDALQERLDTLRKSLEDENADKEALIQATKDVENAEKTRLEADVETAQTAVTALKPSAEKDALQARLDALNQSIEDEKVDKEAVAQATKSVENAETTRLQADIDTAQTAVTALKPSAEKDALQGRLDALRQAIEAGDKEALAQATKAVENAEKTRLQADIDTGQTAVTALKPSAEKDALQTRLDALIKSIEDEKNADNEALTKATKAVENAEKTRLQADVETAQGLVTELKASEEKDALQNRLDGLRQSIEEADEEALAKATKAVEKSETTQLESDIEIAQGLVTALKEDSNKVELQARLDALRNAIEEAFNEAFLKATKAVEKAESTHEQTDIDTAQELIDALKVSSEKDALQKRLDIVQETLNQIVEDQQALSKATSAVEKAETTRLQADFDTANGLVVDLKASEEKDELKTRLDALRQSIDAEKENDKALAEATRGIEKAEESRLLTDVETAQGLVNTLKPSVEKNALQARLDTLRQSINEEHENIEALVKATSAVEKAEATRQQVDVETAQGLINVLMPSAEKTALQSRLDALRNSMEAENTENEAIARATQGVVKAEATRQQVDIEIAQELVTALKSDSAKDSLQARLDALNKSIADEKEADVEASAKATQGVEKAEQSRLQEDIDTAQGLVTALKSSVEKDALQSRLDALKKSIEEGNENDEALSKATSAVVKAETTRLQADIDTAQGLVDKLPDSDSKDDLKSRLDAIQVASDKDDVDKEALAKATKAVVKAETTLVQSDIDKAQRQVTALSNSHEKTALQARLEAVQHVVNQQNTANEALAKATQAVVKAESTRVQADVDKARELVVKLQNSVEEDALYERLDVLQNHIDKELKDASELAKATKAVEKAETTKMQEDVITAQNLVADLAGSASKFALQKRMDAINSTIQIDADGTVTAIFKAPTGDQLKIEKDGLKIEVANDYKTASKVKVSWKPLGADKNQLQVIVDGEEIEIFKNPTKVSVERPHSYLVKEMTNGEKRAVLYNYVRGAFVFETSTAQDVYMFTKEKRTFKDVEDVFSKKEIDELASRYIVYGSTPTTFSPNKDITRGQFSALVARAFDLDTDKATTFKDMEGHMFAGEVQALKDIGIVQGKDAGTFDPNATLTRQQSALMISRLLEHIGSDITPSNPTFNDNSDISQEAWKAVGQLQSVGIFTGKRGNKFDPQSNLTRAQMAKVLHNTLEVAGYIKNPNARTQ